jgi:tRNA dimethylallyltransferase
LTEGSTAGGKGAAGGQQEPDTVDNPMPPLPDLPRDRPVLIAGPTASGKSDLALRLAERDGGVIVNADSMQVWSMWRVLTARPTREDEARAPHRLFGHRGLGASYSVGEWLREVAPILARPDRPIIVGGTGLNLTALTEGLADVPPVPPEVRVEADALVGKGGLDAMIRSLDARTASRIDLANPARVQRAWEVLRATGRGLAEWQDAAAPPLLPLSRAAAFRLEADPVRLAARIDDRFVRMLRAGALDEVRAVSPHWAPRAPWAKVIGAKELMAHLSGELSLDAATRLAQAASRQYAKRQRTWLRARMGHWTPLAMP